MIDMVKHMKKRYIILLCTILSIFFIGYILTGYISSFDTFFYQKIISFKGNSTTNFFIIISDVTYLLVLITALFWILYKNKRLSFLVTLNLGLSFICSYILKFIFKRARPFGIALVIEKGYSMPSSHSMVCISFFGFLFYYIYKNFKKGMFKNSLLMGIAFYILMIGISRIYLGVHYASDVLLGFTFGLIYLSIFIKLFQKEIVLTKEK